MVTFDFFFSNRNEQPILLVLVWMKKQHRTSEAENKMIESIALSLVNWLCVTRRDDCVVYLLECAHSLISTTNLNMFNWMFFWSMWHILYILQSSQYMSIISLLCFCLQVLVVQSPSPSLQIKEPPPSPGSPTSETMYATAGGGTQIYMQVSLHTNSPILIHFILFISC